MSQLNDNLLPYRGVSRADDFFFSTDENDELVAQEKATKEKFKELVLIKIDGHEIQVPKAVPETDFLGNPILDFDGLPKPRDTTIYDAAKMLVEQGQWEHGEVEKRIPILCHQEHLDPVAVCRVCSVHVQKFKKSQGKAAPNPTLVPACQHRVEVDMIVTTRGSVQPIEQQTTKIKKLTETINSPSTAPEELQKKLQERTLLQSGIEASVPYSTEVLKSTQAVVEMLVIDHYHPNEVSDVRFRNELAEVAKQLRIPLPLANEPAPRTGSMLVGKVRSNQNSRNEPEGLHPKSRRRIELPMSEKGRVNSITDIVVSAQEIDINKPVRPNQPKKYDAFPYSSPTVSVNHDRCILCDRCARSCHDVKPFKIIGHTGKGYRSRISFDLDEIMDDSGCVQCGECMNSCPTGALTLNRRILPKQVREVLELTDIDDPEVLEKLQYYENPIHPLPREQGFLPADEIVKIEAKYYDPKGVVRTFFPFVNVPKSYLIWNEGAVRERTYQPGEILCEQGDYGNTAYILKSGKFEIYEREKNQIEEPAGWLGWLTGRKRMRKVEDFGERRVVLGPEVTILGELGCLTHQPRTSTIRVAEESVVYEITRNLLDMVQRSKIGREVLDLIYTRNSIRSSLAKNRLLRGMDGKVLNDIVNLLNTNPDNPSDTAKLLRVEPGKSIVAEGAESGGFYMLRLGTVKVARKGDGGEVILATLSAANYDYFGEGTLLEGGVRSASVTALDPVEVVSLSPSLFYTMTAKFPELEARLRDSMAAIRTAAGAKKKRHVHDEHLTDYLNLGLYQGQNLFVLDLKSCTRCDECTRACADSHDDGFSRLLREGLRFGEYLVAASCRSCHKPYCMDGCPVDAIHRSGTDLQIKIDSHCITCGLCEKNCPYGAIQIPEKDEYPNRAVNCDKCQDLVPEGADPFCVAACPHGAAIRINGPDLLARVRSQTIVV